MKRPALVLGGLAVVLVVPFLVWGEGFEARFTAAGARQWLLERSGPPWIWGIGLLVADLVLPVPATAVAAALGWIHGPWAGGAAAAAGSFLAGLAGFGACRLAGPRAARWLLGGLHAAGRRRFGAALPWLVVVGRFLPLVPEVTACAAGLARLPWRVFAPALALGSAGMGFGFAALGASTGEDSLLGVVLAAGLPALLWLLLRPRLDPAARGRA